jgi:hypothetical protein
MTAAMKKTAFRETWMLSSTVGVNRTWKTLIAANGEAEYATQYSYRTWPVLSLRPLKVKPKAHPYTN